MEARQGSVAVEAPDSKDLGANETSSYLSLSKLRVQDILYIHQSWILDVKHLRKKMVFFGALRSLNQVAFTIPSY